MDEKVKATMKGIYDNLSDELKEKAKACKTMDELTALAAREGIELPDEVLDAIAGGMRLVRSRFDCPRLDYPCEIYGGCH